MSTLSAIALVLSLPTVAADAIAEQAQDAALEAEATDARLRAAEEASEAAERRARERASRERERAVMSDPWVYARALVGAEQFPCLDRLWTRESNWRHTATNQASGAYGIPQALPGSKMASAGPDWRSNPMTQVRWGVSYIKRRYGSPCAAWAHSEAVGWY